MHRYRNGRRQPIPDRSSIVGGLERAGEEIVVCLLRSDGHFERAAGQSRLMGASRIANSEVVAENE
jgi:hypothetical protein